MRILCTVDLQEFDVANKLLNKLWSHFTDTFNGNEFTTTVSNHGFSLDQLGSRKGTMGAIKLCKCILEHPTINLLYNHYSYLNFLKTAAPISVTTPALAQHTTPQTTTAISVASSSRPGSPLTVQATPNTPSPTLLPFASHFCARIPAFKQCESLLNCQTPSKSTGHPKTCMY